MRRKFKHRPRSRICLLLCAALLCTGPISPLQTYASVGDPLNEDPDPVVEDIDDGDGDGGDDYDEPTGSGNGTENISDQTEKIQQQIDEANEKAKQYKEEEERIKAEIASAQGEKAQAAAVQRQIGDKIAVQENQIYSLQQSISLLEERIALLEADIEQKQEDIEQKQDDIDYNYERFKGRVRNKYMQDDGTMLGLLLGSDSFSDYLTKVEYMGRIAQRDQDLMALLTEERIAIEEDKELLELTKVSVEEDREQVVQNKAATEVIRQELQQDYSVAQSQVHSLEQMEAAFMADLEKNKQMQTAMKAEIDKLYRDLEFSKNPYVGGEMMWPLQGFYTISSYYGSRFGGSDFHTGTDITGSGVMGANIVAANDGVVAFVNTNYSPGSGYGIYVMLDHGIDESGRSVSTLYAHCSAITVGMGQTVKKGDIIAKVGSTGWSTGPHLHFEVRLDGKSVNSLPYIQGN